MAWGFLLELIHRTTDRVYTVNVQHVWFNLEIRANWTIIVSNLWCTCLLSLQKFFLYILWIDQDSPFTNYQKKKIHQTQLILISSSQHHNFGWWNGLSLCLQLTAKQIPCQLAAVDDDDIQLKRKFIQPPVSVYRHPSCFGGSLGEGQHRPTKARKNPRKMEWITPRAVFMLPHQDFSGLAMW